MPVHRENRVLPYHRDQFFDLVADVESYPEFLPHWRSARIYRRDGDVYFTEQEIGFGPFMSQRFRSRTQLERPAEIEVTSDESIFSHLRIVWQFEPVADNGCRVDFEMSCEASSLFLIGFIDLMLNETARSMVAAFEARAHKILGPNAG